MTPPRPRAPAPALTPARIALIYVVVAGLWILLSDRLVEAMPGDAAWHARLQTYKGWAFVVASGWGLYALVASADRMRRRERGLAAAVLASADRAMLVSDAEHRFVLANAAAETLLGVAPGQIVGRSADELFVPDTAAQVRARAARVLATGVADRGEEVWMLPARRAPAAMVQVAASPLADADGRPAWGVAWSVADVTGARSEEQAARQREKLEALGRLAGGIAHDVNNVLTVISAASDMALEELPPGHAARTDVDEARKAAWRAGEMMQRLLAFGRHQPGVRQPVALDAAVSDIVALLRRIVPPVVQVVDEADGTAGEVHADPSMVAQAVMHLVLAAADAMPGGGVILVRTTSIDVGGDQASGSDLPPGRYAAVRVSDTGLGMDAATVARAADRAWEGPLATADAQAREHGGRLLLESLVGHGTVASLYLPATTPRPGAEPPAQPRDDATEAGARILLAEDEAPLRILAKRVLVRAGFDVRDARHGADALLVVDALRRDGDECPIDLLVSDLVMPELGGADLAARLRERWPHLPVLFVSGYTDGARVADVEDGGTTRLLDKPFSADGLIAAVRDVLAASRARHV